MKIKKDDAHYDVMAKQYVNVREKEEYSYVDHFNECVDFSFSSKKVLDLGCGSAPVLMEYVKLGAEGFGIDSSLEMVRQAHAKSPLLHITQGTMEELPYEDMQFDIVTSQYAMQIVEDLSPVFKEVSRVLKPGGVFMFLTKAPIMQFLAKKKHPKDYFKKEEVSCRIFDGEIIVKEPSHTMKDYINQEILQLFDLTLFEEGYDFPASEQINGDIFPCYMILKYIKR